jgi:hypothetical protein
MPWHRATVAAAAVAAPLPPVVPSSELLERLHTAYWPELARRFVLHRAHDPSGVSGTGVVADGVMFPDGHVALRWRGTHGSTVCWTELADALAIHGHGGLTRCVWVDTGAPA